MISYVHGNLFQKDLCCKFMLKNDIKNYHWQFTKTLSICFQWNTTHADLVMCNYFYLEQLNSSTKYGILLDKYIRFIE